MRHVIRLVSFIVVLLALAIPNGATAQTPRFSVTIPRSAYPSRLTGRLVLAIAKAAQPEPRLLISPRGPALFAIDLDALEPGQAAIIDGNSLGTLRSEDSRDRVDVCERCHGYVKAIATFTSVPTPKLAAEDAATVHLDVGAREAGYTRPGTVDVETAGIPRLVREGRKPAGD